MCCPAALLNSCHQSPPVLLQLLSQSCLPFGLFFFPEEILKETLCAERVELSYVVWGAGTRELSLEAVGDRS